MTDEPTDLPQVAVPDREDIPDRYAERAHWLWWDADENRPRKPLNKDGYGASWSDPDAWVSFEEAREHALKKPSRGIGYVFAASIDDAEDGTDAALDLDGIAEDPHRSPKEWLPSMQPFFDHEAFAEWSPSGTGWHIPLKNYSPPEWWTDSHFTDDEHEGVEAYDKKFFTFTGDQVNGTTDTPAEGGEWVDEWLREAYKAINGEDPLESRSATLGDSDGSDDSEFTQSQREEFLDEDSIRDALSHVDADVGYTTWRDIGFALADFFDSDHTAMSVFEDWSRSGNKWDSEAEDLAERIIGDATNGGGRTIGTVIHHAKRGGWDMPTPSPTTGDRDAVDHDDGSPWAYAVETYASDETTAGDARVAATKSLEEETSWMYVAEEDALYAYDDETGRFEGDGKNRAREMLVRHLGPYYSQHERREIIDRIRGRNTESRDAFNAAKFDGYLVCVGNGVVRVAADEIELLDHDPKYRFVRGVDYDFNPDADADRVQEFLSGVTGREEDAQTLIQQLGHGLLPGHPFKAFVVMHGGGNNGKSQVEELFERLVGEENADAVELRDFQTDDFATGDLPGKMLNLGGDLSGKKIKDASTLKKLTGDDSLKANKKNQQQYKFKNEAAMFFAGNSPPVFEEQTGALKSRLYPVHLPHKFTADPNDSHRDAEPEIAKKIADDDAQMETLLRLALEGVQELIRTGGEFAMPEGPDERMAMYEAASDPLLRFIRECLESTEDSSDRLLKGDVYQVYSAMCDAEGEKKTGDQQLKRKIARHSDLDVEEGRTRTLTEGDDRPYCWKYVRFTEDAREHMTPRLRNRYFDSADDGDDSSRGAASDAMAGDEGGELADLSKGILVSLRATLAERLDAPDWLEGEGHLVDDEGNILPYEVRGTDALSGISEGATLHLRNVRVEDGKSGLTVVITGITDVRATMSSGQQGGLTADGGEKTTTDDEGPDSADLAGEGSNPRKDAREVADLLGDGTMSKVDLANRAAKELRVGVGNATDLIQLAHKKYGFVEKLSGGEYRQV